MSSSEKEKKDKAVYSPTAGACLLLPPHLSVGVSVCMYRYLCACVCVLSRAPGNLFPSFHKSSDGARDSSLPQVCVGARVFPPHANHSLLSSSYSLECVSISVCVYMRVCCVCDV